VLGRRVRLVKNAGDRRQRVVGWVALIQVGAPIAMSRRKSGSASLPVFPASLAK
jgi:hypothetical protein